MDRETRKIYLKKKSLPTNNETERTQYSLV